MATAMMPAHADIISDSEQIMGDAQKVYPNLFPFKQETQILEPYRYRFYPSTEIYLGINQHNSGVYLLGAQFGDTPQYVDNTKNVMTLLKNKLAGSGGSGRSILNDTGIIGCANKNTNNLTCPQGSYPNQDAQYGRDVTHNDNSDGQAGFSFTKLDSTGNPLSASATDWSCVKDNVTGLIWEVKTDDDGLRDKNWHYTWYNSTGINDGGSAGTANGGSCFDADNCDTEKFVQQVNSQGLCGKKDWRMPTINELENIVNFNSSNPAIDTDYLPNTNSSGFWLASPNANYSGSAWYVHFNYGALGNDDKNDSKYVRLVREGQ
jgi:hypothetical protein